MFDNEILKKMIRFEVDPKIFSGDPEEAEADNPEEAEADNLEAAETEAAAAIDPDKDDLLDIDNYDGSYKPDHMDIAQACRNMIKAGADIETFLNWHYFVSEYLEQYFEEIYDIFDDHGYLWPDNEDDILRALDNAISALDLYDESSTPEDIKEDLSDIILMAENYEYNKDRDLSEWKYSKYQIDEIFEFYDEDAEEIPASKREAFKMLVEKECAQENPHAMKIKGYGCYGGNEIFECDWEESRRLITSLFEKEEDPFYANTLGYIYYYGRCNNGIPDYEMAFKYFSIGAACDIIESMYKLADMFQSGKGCIKSPETAAHIINKLYDDGRPGFCYGNEAKFADVALRMASYCQKKKMYEPAMFHYLEADLAIKRRLKEHDYYGDKKVQSNILKSIDEVKGILGPEFFSDELKAGFPYWILEMIWDDREVKIEVENIEGNRYRLKITRKRADNGARALVVVPEFERAVLTYELTTEFVTDEPVIYEYNDKSNMYFDNIDLNDENEVSFYNGENVIFKVRNAEYILRKSDLKESEESISYF